jgi:hypothetical protein
MIIQAAVNHADRWRVVGERVESRCIFQRQIERFGGCDVRNRWKIDCRTSSIVNIV